MVVVVRRARNVLLCKSHSIDRCDCTRESLYDEEAFAADVAACISGLSDPLRVRIRLALAATRESDWTHSGLHYATLRERLGVEDGGRLNYHLDELRGTFVTSKDGHYSLTAAGSRIVGEMYAGTFTGQHDKLDGPVEYDCMQCDRQLTASVAGGILSVTCPDHGQVYEMVPPYKSVKHHSLTKLYEIARRQAWQYVGSVRSDVCPHCGNAFAGPTVEHAVPKDESGTSQNGGSTPAQ